MTTREIDCSTPEGVTELIQFAAGLVEPVDGLVITIKRHNQRTWRQNRSLHKYCELVAEALNDSGQTKRLVYDQWYAGGREMLWTMEDIKEDWWRVIMKALQGKESTTEQSTTDPDEVYKFMAMKLAERGIDVPWPSNSPPMIGDKAA